ncbi:MAG: hypothetical protein IJA33_01605 [Oscillospiraceae bacterium]|nr:hypothetical protein [Oscillospiraceae bacterium]
MKNKRLLALLLALCCLVTLIPFGTVSAHASEAEGTVTTVSIPWQVNPIYEDVLGDSAPAFYAAAAPVKTYGDVTYVSEEEAAETIREAMVNRETAVQVHFKTTNADINQTVGDLIALALEHTGDPVEGDYISFTYGGWHVLNDGSSSYYYNDGAYYATIVYNISYYTDAAQEATMDTEVTKLLNQLDLYDSSDYQKLRGIYDYMTENIRYDYANLNDSSYLLKHTSYAALINKTSVCQGYASLFYRLALELDVDARIISGIGGTGDSAGPHAWNIAKLGSKYYNLDATWDEGRQTYSWFLLSPASFSRHYRNLEYTTTAFNSAYPMSATDYEPIAGVQITSHPANKTVNAGETAQFSVAATGGTIAYQWQQKAPSGSDWENATAAGAKTATLTVSASLPYDGYQYRCKVSNDAGSVYSNAATLTVKAAGSCAQHSYSDNVDGTCNYCGVNRETVEARVVVHMFRMYNPNTGEHFYTGSPVERDNLIVAGWQYEGVGFTFPANTGDPVHRLFQPSTGEHLYTMDVAEKDRLMADGWNYEGIAFNSAYDTEAVQHRLHNPNAEVGAYHFTFSPEEKQNLIDAGWEYQGIGWYSCFK